MKTQKKAHAKCVLHCSKNFITVLYNLELLPQFEGKVVLPNRLQAMRVSLNL